ncbi:MAG: FAD-binding domain-containing protein [Methylophilaceae bacterium]
MTKSYKLTIPSDRTERLQYIKRMFPDAADGNLSDEWHGGRNEAIKRLNSIDIKSYNRNHDFTIGTVSKLSPYFRHGCITLKEAVDKLREKYGIESEKFVYELARRDYWRRVWYSEGDNIFNNIEPPKVPISDKPMPDYIRQMVTGLPCMDAFVRDLIQDGYVHNHARKWFAAYVVHWLKVDWREAADWFENQLLDGDKATNHLSWQWVASTFSSRPYFFNKDVLARFTGEKYCENCKVNCPFDASMPAIEEKLFPEVEIEPIAERSITRALTSTYSSHTAIAVFVHDEMLSAAHPLLKNSAPKFFVFDTNVHGKWPLKRIQFVADCLSELPGVEIWMGDTQPILEERAVGQLMTQNTPNLEIKKLLEPFKVEWQPEVNFCESTISEKRMKRFSRYWSKVGEEFFGDQLTIKPK